MTQLLITAFYLAMSVAWTYGTVPVTVPTQEADEATDRLALPPLEDESPAESVVPVPLFEAVEIPSVPEVTSSPPIASGPGESPPASPAVGEPVTPPVHDDPYAWPLSEAIALILEQRAREGSPFQGTIFDDPQSEATFRAALEATVQARVPFRPVVRPRATGDAPVAEWTASPVPPPPVRSRAPAEPVAAPSPHLAPETADTAGAELVRQLRTTARAMDEQANDLEERDAYAEADALRQLAQQLRTTARRWQPSATPERPMPPRHAFDPYAPYGPVMPPDMLPAAIVPETLPPPVHQAPRFFQEAQTVQLPE